MYRRILVPLDGTHFGDHALPYAVRIASRTGAALELVHVHRPYELEAELDAMPQYHYQHVEEAAADIEVRYGVSTSTRVLHGGTARALTQEAQDIVADLVVMATHARRGISRLMHGDIAHQLVHDFNIPMLTVHPPVDDGPLAAGELNHFLVTLDGSAFSEQILDVVVPLAEGLGARVSLMHVYSHRTLKYNGLQPEQRVVACHAEAVRYLEAVADRLPDSLREPQLVVAASDDPASAIVDALTGAPAAALAIATHGRSGLSRMVLGSVAERVVQAMHQPVLLYRPRLARLPEGFLASAFGLEGN
jgi:nucleotide-binding universal stress UspA family protein